jgi:hypothetical protein
MKAFPHSFEKVPNHPRFAESEGMDLRDYFAAKAMQGFLAEGTAFGVKAGETIEQATARVSYLQADAMMKAREKK